jgi:hypothetical protein
LHQEPNRISTTASGVERRITGWLHSRRFWISLGSIAIALLVTAGIAAEYAIHHAEPILRRRVIETLSARFQTQVQLGALHISIFKGISATGEGLVVPGIANQGEVAQPLLKVKTFEFRTSMRSLLRTPMHVDTVYVQGLEFRLPPKGERPKMPPRQAGSGKVSIVVDTIVCTDAMLEIETNKPNKVPLEFDISRLTLTNVGPGQPFQFIADLTNPKPVGDISASGNFGPYQIGSPADTPVSGHYNFSNADLSTTKGISGILSSTGDFQGLLSNIVVDGQTDTPDFALDVSDHAVPLQTKFHAIVDGTNGDVTLVPVHAKLLNSTFTARGSITRTKGIPGHDIEMDVVMDHARIEDILMLGFKTTPPLISGALAMHAKMSLPPGKIRVAQKIHLKGNFTISGAIFSNSKMQDKVDMLSLRAQGQPKLANPAGAAAINVQSQMTGNFKAGDGTLAVTNLQYNLPGAQALMDGQYTMDGKTFDFHGIVRTKATASQMTTGIKSDLLKPFDRIFEKNGSGTQIPVKISGTKNEPHFGLDFRDKRKWDHSLPPPPQ